MNLKFIIFTILLFSVAIVFAQKPYWTTSGSYILSFSNAAYENPTNPGTMISIADAPRFTLWPNVDFYYNYDFHKNIGIYTGLGLNNIGLITKEKSSTLIPTGPNYNEDVKWKRRAYTFSVPLALKIGKIDDGFHFIIGGQYEYLFHYKEKEFLSTGKRKETEWFSNRVNTFIPSLFAGIAFKGGYSIKFTYALNDFLNKNYSYTNTAGNIIEPYKTMDSRILYISFFINNTFEELTKPETKLKQIALL
jgi:hypothetical protein